MRMKLKFFDFGTWSIAGNRTINGPVDPTLPVPLGYGTTCYRSSLWKPSIQSTHVPHYAEQMAQFYTYYRVTGFKYRLKVCNELINQSTWVAVSHQTDPGVEPGHTFNELIEDNRVKFRTMNSVNGAKNYVILKGYVDVAKTWGQSVGSVADDKDFRAAFTQLPSKMAYLVPMVVTNWPQESADPIPFDFDIHITYYVTFEDRMFTASVN